MALAVRATSEERSIVSGSSGHTTPSRSPSPQPPLQTGEAHRGLPAAGGVTSSRGMPDNLSSQRLLSGVPIPQAQVRLKLSKGRKLLLEQDCAEACVLRSRKDGCVANRLYTAVSSSSPVQGSTFSGCWKLQQHSACLFSAFDLWSCAIWLRMRPIARCSIAQPQWRHCRAQRQSTLAG